MIMHIHICVLSSCLLCSQESLCKRRSAVCQSLHPSSSSCSSSSSSCFEDTLSGIHRVFLLSERRMASPRGETQEVNVDVNLRLLSDKESTFKQSSAALGEPHNSSLMSCLTWCRWDMKRETKAAWSVGEPFTSNFKGSLIQLQFVLEELKKLQTLNVSGVLQTHVQISKHYTSLLTQIWYFSKSRSTQIVYLSKSRSTQIQFLSKSRSNQFLSKSRSNQILSKSRSTQILQ